MFGGSGCAHFQDFQLHFSQMRPLVTDWISSMGCSRARRRSCKLHSDSRGGRCAVETRSVMFACVLCCCPKSVRLCLLVRQVALRFAYAGIYDARGDAHHLTCVQRMQLFLSSLSSLYLPRSFVLRDASVTLHDVIDGRVNLLAGKPAGWLPGKGLRIKSTGLTGSNPGVDRVEP